MGRTHGAHQLLAHGFHAVGNRAIYLFGALGSSCPSNVLGSLQLNSGPKSVDVARLSPQGQGSGGQGVGQAWGTGAALPSRLRTLGGCSEGRRMWPEGLVRSVTLASETWTGPCGRIPT